MASPRGSNAAGTISRSRCAIYAQRRTSGTSPWDWVERWPTWTCWPSHAICELAAVRGQKGDGETTTRFTAPGGSANTSWQSASAHAAARQRVRMLIRQSSSMHQRWLRKHRGAAESTVRLYSRGAADLLTALGDDPGWWDAKGVRDYFLERASKCGTGTAEKLTTGLRVFLRYLSARGLCQADLDQAVPTFASWRLARLPRYLTAEQVDSLVAACDGSSPARRRDRAMILLLARLGLRAGDVAGLRIADIEWEAGTLRVAGKGGYQVRLPLPQDVGDAILDYLACRAPVRDCDHIFIRNVAPYRPFTRGDGVSSVVRCTMQRAGVVSPAKGAHVLRHTAATQMLRHGVPLDQIGLVLRHRGIDTTAYYAKADINLLKEIAQPWPEVLP